MGVSYNSSKVLHLFVERVIEPFDGSPPVNLAIPGLPATKREMLAAVNIDTETVNENAFPHFQNG